MTKIKLYDNDGNISLQDKVIGTDAENNEETKNYTFESIINFMKANGLGFLVGVDDSLLVHKAGNEDITGQKTFTTDPDTDASIIVDNSDAEGKPALKIVKNGDDKMIISDDGIVIAEGNDLSIISAFETKIGNSVGYTSTTAEGVSWANEGSTKINRLNYAKATVGEAEFEFPDKPTGTYTLMTTDDLPVVLSGPWTLGLTAGVQFNDSHWIRVGDVVSVTLSGFTVGTITTSALPLPNGFVMHTPVDGKIIGTGIVIAPSLFYSVKILQQTDATKVGIEVTGGGDFSVTFSFKIVE